MRGDSAEVDGTRRPATGRVRGFADLIFFGSGRRPRSLLLHRDIGIGRAGPPMKRSARFVDVARPINLERPLQRGCESRALSFGAGDDAAWVFFFFLFFSPRL